MPSVSLEFQDKQTRQCTFLKGRIILYSIDSLLENLDYIQLAYFATWAQKVSHRLSLPQSYFFPERQLWDTNQRAHRVRPVKKTTPAKIKTKEMQIREQKSQSYEVKCEAISRLRKNFTTPTCSKQY